MKISQESISRRNFFPVFMSIAALSVTGLFYYVVVSPMGPVQNTADVLGAATQRSVEMATLRVRTGTAVKTYTDISFESGSTAFDFLKEVRDTTSFTFGAEKYDFGWYVHSINGRRALNNEYWKLTVNGEKVEENVDEYVMADGDYVEFVLSEF